MSTRTGKPWGIVHRRLLPGLLLSCIMTPLAAQPTWEEKAAAAMETNKGLGGKFDTQAYHQALKDIMRQQTLKDIMHQFPAVDPKQQVEQDWKVWKEEQTREQHLRSLNREKRLRLLNKKSALAKKTRARLEASRASRNFARQAEKDGKWTAAERAEYDRLYTHELQLWDPTPKEQQAFNKASNTRYQVLTVIKNTAQGLGGISVEDIAKRAQVDKMYDAATKTWRDATFTGKMVSETKDDIARQREISLRAENMTMAAQIYLRRKDITSEQARAARQILASSQLLKAHAELGQALDTSLITAGASADVLMLGLGKPIAKIGEAAGSAAKSLFARGAEKAAEKTVTTTVTAAESAASRTATGVIAREAQTATENKLIQEALNKMSDAERAIYEAVESGKKSASELYINEIPLYQNAAERVEQTIYEAVRSGRRAGSELSQVERQIFNDSLYRLEQKALTESGEVGEDLLPKPIGALDELPVGELTKNLSQEERAALFKPGAELTEKELTQKVDLLRQGYRRGPNGIVHSPARSLPPRAPVTGEPVTGETLPPPAGGVTLPPPGDNVANVLLGNTEDQIATVILGGSDDVATMNLGHVEDQLATQILSRAGDDAVTVLLNKSADDITTVILDHGGKAISVEAPSLGGIGRVELPLTETERIAGKGGLVAIITRQADGTISISIVKKAALHNKVASLILRVLKTAEYEANKKKRQRDRKISPPGNKQSGTTRPHTGNSSGTGSGGGGGSGSAGGGGGGNTVGGGQGSAAISPIYFAFGPGLIRGNGGIYTLCTPECQYLVDLFDTLQEDTKGNPQLNRKKMDEIKNLTLPACEVEMCTGDYDTGSSISMFPPVTGDCTGYDCPNGCADSGCTGVKVLQAFSTGGMNFWNFQELEQIGMDSGNTASGAGSSGSGSAAATISVIKYSSYFIPVSQLTVHGPDVCPADHYHSDTGLATTCSGGILADPNPGSCGYGMVSATINIPLSSCPSH